MLGAINAALRGWRYGEPVVVVSGLPRSGTSMMMRMLEAGGLGPVTDGERVADVDNPKGYFELERVKDLERETDKSYVRQARGKALKVISFLLRYLPDDNAYDVIFMRRDLGEVLASQDKMIQHRGSADSTDAEALKEAYRHDIARARTLARTRKNVRMLEVQYARAVAEPQAVAAEVAAFLGRPMDVAAMVQAVDPSLYRNRAG